MTSLPKRPARLTLRLLAFAAAIPAAAGQSDTFTLSTISEAGLPVGRQAVSARIIQLGNEGYLRRVRRGVGGLHHWQRAIWQITDRGRQRLEQLRRDRRLTI
jgi:hypothetical protein